MNSISGAASKQFPSAAGVVVTGDQQDSFDPQFVKFSRGRLGFFARGVRLIREGQKIGSGIAGLYRKRNRQIAFVKAVVPAGPLITAWGRMPWRTRPPL